MLQKVLYILLEGEDDETYFEHLFVPILKGRYKDVRLVPYAKGKEGISKRKFLCNFIRSIRRELAVIILFGDLDHYKCIREKKKEIKELITPTRIDDNEIMVVIAEIESWYAAGIDESKLHELNISNDDMIKKVRAHENLIKKQFDLLIPKKIPRRSFLLTLLENYDLDLAKRRNKSLDYFITKIIQTTTTN